MAPPILFLPEHPGTTGSDAMTSNHQDELLAHHLRRFLGDIEPAALELLRNHLQWVEVAAGQTLMAQGDPGDSMYLSISGRLRAYVRDADGVEHMVREMTRGQIIGELSLYTDEPRSASVVAIRDSVLVRLDKPGFRSLLASSSQVSIVLTRQIIERLRTPQGRADLPRPVTIGLLPVTQGVQARAQAAIGMIDSGSAKAVPAVVKQAATLPPPSMFDPSMLPGGPPPTEQPQPQNAPQ